MNNLINMRIIAAGAFSITALIAQADTVILSCAIKEQTSKNEGLISAVLDEKNRTAIVNESFYKDVQFDVSTISGEHQMPHFLIPGLVLKSSFNIDRVTGRVILMSNSITENGSELSEEQKMLMKTRNLNAFFWGVCKKTSQQF